MPIKIEIVVEETREKCRDGKERPVVNSYFRSDGMGTARETELHNILALAFKMIAEEQGRRHLGTTIWERDGRKKR